MTWFWDDDMVRPQPKVNKKPNENYLVNIYKLKRHGSYYKSLENHLLFGRIPPSYI